ncbi:MAG: hypothetical protein HY470_00625 [Candidatus Ryanbacteria bacterium]|nr:hypothetical protein [Candidatus Ryanbacteria bacterium]
MLLLLAGVVISLNRSPKVQWRVLKTLPKAFRFIDRTVLIRTLKEFYRDRLVDWRQEKDGTVKIVLTDLGRKRALRYKIDELFIQMPLRWDKKWRIVMFDIPEKKKIAREAFRNKLQELGFVQFQKSAWVFPYPCKDIIDFIVEVFEIRSYVQYTEAVYITNDAKLRIHFDLK